MLGDHAAAAIPLERCDRAWVITASPNHPCVPGWQARGFEPVINPNASEGIGTSVALAARLAKREGMSALLIALADMPLVPREHLTALIEAVAGNVRIAVSSNGDARTPPAAFGSDHFDALANLGGETGARSLLGQGEIVACPSRWLADVDTPDELNRIA